MAPGTRAWTLIGLLLLSSVLAGCLGDEDPTGTGDTDAAAGEGADGNATAYEPGTKEFPMVYGHVTDVSRNPLAGARVTVQTLGLTVVTNETGYYQFESLEPETPQTLIANASGFKRKALQVVPVAEAQVQLDFALDEIPDQTPYATEFPRVGFIACGFNVAAGHDHGKDGNTVREDCAPNDPNNKPTLDFEIPAGAMGVVVDIRWEAKTDLAEFLMAELETVGFGEQDRHLGYAIGPSTMTLTLSHDAVAKFFHGGGGVLRLTMSAHPEDDDEQAAGASFVFQQDFETLVTVFFVEPNPPGYSGFDAE